MFTCVEAEKPACLDNEFVRGSANHLAGKVFLPRRGLGKELGGGARRSGRGEEGEEDEKRDGEEEE